MDPINTLSILKSIKIKFASRTIVLSNLTTFGVAVGATVQYCRLKLKLKIDLNYTNIYIEV
jgi:hypothetical protein